MDRGAWWATVHGVQRVGHDQEGCIYTEDSVAPGSLYLDDWHTTEGKKKCGHGAQPASPCLALRAAVNLLSLRFARPLSLPVNSHLHQKLESVHCSVMSNSAIPWFVACQAPLSMEVSRQEYWNPLPVLLQGISPTQGSHQCLLYLQHCRQILYCLSPRMWKGYQEFQCRGPPCCMSQSLMIRKLDCFQSLTDVNCSKHPCSFKSCLHP